VCTHFPTLQTGSKFICYVFWLAGILITYGFGTQLISANLLWIIYFHLSVLFSGEVTKVCGVASQGRPEFVDQGDWFVKTYTLAYSKDGENWANYKEFGIAKVMDVWV